jgi:surfeit locus 1 family protein
MNIMSFFSKKWIVTTILVVVAVVVMTRLGFWQLDRLEQRKAFNKQLMEQISQDQLELNANNLDLDLTKMEYRKIVVRGRYDFSQEVALNNQVWDDQIGVRLLTPLIISGTDQAVIVDRGWIPLNAYLTGDWSEFNESGEVIVDGIIRTSESGAIFSRIANPEIANGEQLRSLNLVDIPRLSEQIPYSVTPVYIQKSSTEDVSKLPYSSVVVPELSEGSHLSYAIQWFAFATILTIGYPIYMNKDKSMRLREGNDVFSEAI